MNYQRRRKTGSALAECMNAMMAIVFAALTFWGIGWSFYRHGPLDGVIAVLVPPYAWYRGVAAIWEQPKWKKRYDSKTEQLAVIIGNSFNNDPDYKLQSRDYIHSLKTWISSLPSKERNKLFLASQGYGSAITTFLREYLTAMLNGDLSPHPEDAPSVQKDIAAFIEIKGFYTMWKELLGDSASLQELMSAIRDRTAESSASGASHLSAEEREKVERAIDVLLRTMKARVDATIDDLFPQVGA